MTRKRLTAVALTAFILVLPLTALSTLAFAQLGRAEPAHGQPPAAAPTAPAAESQPLEGPSAVPTTTIDATLVGPQENGAGADFSPVALFMRADIVVKTVLVLLVLASFWSWVIIIDKSFTYSTLRRKADRFEQTFWSGRSLDELYAHYSTRADHPIAALFVAALREWRRSFEHGTPRDALIPGVKERVGKAMAVSIQREIAKIERGLGYLATVGSTAPFVGLFGTVWGIMNSFRSIAALHNTTLAVVAPGIAEALFATALGLAAAIPAVVAYNKFVNDVGRYTGRLEGFADEFAAFLSRQLDERTH